MRRAILAVALLAACALAALPPLSVKELNERATMIVQAEVVAVETPTTETVGGDPEFTNVRHTFLVKPLVTVKKDPATWGPTMRVHTWAVGSRPRGWTGPSGHRNRPAAKGDVRVFYLNVLDGKLVPIEPNGIMDSSVLSDHEEL